MGVGAGVSVGTGAGEEFGECSEESLFCEGPAMGVEGAGGASCISASWGGSGATPAPPLPLPRPRPGPRPPRTLPRACFGGMLEMCKDRLGMNGVIALELLRDSCGCRGIGCDNVNCRRVWRGCKIIILGPTLIYMIGHDWLISSPCYLK